MSFFLSPYWASSIAACDPYWDYVPLLLHFDGTDGDTAVPVNSSSSGIEMFRNSGNLSSAEARFGPTSSWFPGAGTNSAGSRIYTATSPLLTLGTGDFTIEFNLFVVTAPAVSAILVDGRAALTQGAYPTLYLSPSMTLGYYVNAADRITSASALSLSTWYHVAIVRSAGVTKLYVNGTQYGSSWTDSTNYIADGLVFGASSYHTAPNTQYGLYGYMDEVRVTVGIARYTATFTPPTEAFAASGDLFPAMWDINALGSGIVLSGNSMIASHSVSASSYCSVRATGGITHTSSGYFEVQITAMEAGGYIMVGIGKSSAALSLHVGKDADGWGYYGATGSPRKYNNDAYSSYGAAFAQGDVIGVAFKNGKVWFAKNNTWNGNPTADTGEAFSGITGTVFPMVSLYDGSAPVDSVTGRFKTAYFSYSPPSGFSPWVVSP